MMQPQPEMSLAASTASHRAHARLAPSGAAGLLARLGITHACRGQLFGALGTVGALHLLGWGLFAFYAAHTHNLAYAGAGALAYTLGLRHAFDADHISAIDDSARLLVQRGRRPVAIGLYFSLGHATVVLALTVIVAVGARSVESHIDALGRFGGVIGAGVSGLFLYIVAGLNLFVLLQLVRAARKGAALDAGPSGAVSMLLGQRWLRFIRHEAQLYPVGFLFGLGFDTASEIALLGLTTSAATRDGLPAGAILALPLIFAAGMTLLDTADGFFMVRAYAWAQHDPARKLRYNLLTTALSVAVAFGVGTLELAGVLSRELAWHGAWVDAVSSLNDRFEALGAVVVALFALLWLGAQLASRRSPEASV